uniref:Uncharacterized protein n=1 Tax=Rhizophora mucronata TaxID=61149 RepID=A0A2P2P784_RHIMU
MTTNSTTSLTASVCNNKVLYCNLEVTGSSHRDRLFVKIGVRLYKFSPFPSLTV